MSGFGQRNGSDLAAAGVYPPSRHLRCNLGGPVAGLPPHILTYAPPPLSSRPLVVILPRRTGTTAYQRRRLRARGALSGREHHAARERHWRHSNVAGGRPVLVPDR